MGFYCGGSGRARSLNFTISWRLPAGGHAAELVTEGIEEVGIARVEPGAPAEKPCFNGGGGVNWMRGPGGDVKIVRLNRKTPAHLVRRGIWGIQPRPRVWKRLRVRDHLCGDHVDAKTREACAGPCLLAVHDSELA